MSLRQVASYSGNKSYRWITACSNAIVTNAQQWRFVSDLLYLKEQREFCISTQRCLLHSPNAKHEKNLELYDTKSICIMEIRKDSYGKCNILMQNTDTYRKTDVNVLPRYSFPTLVFCMSTSCSGLQSLRLYNVHHSTVNCKRFQP